ncbi:LysR family transcriptional regulator [Microbacterium sp. NC79]|uniref:LysR family transcriptional regulator n=1 Tax=Microbacterium sp. NC79 TaxID=2851009 RepID=UPI001C2C325F|nr:LysR family transcriptional regulator [Microbacterium sp. NC79]MBV0896141.1 LysR family transcriptional regulator [Microbacterium sp. NC79]
MDLQQLRYFTAVAGHGSISAGAASLGVTQPTISQALQSLEHEMKTPLFSRVGRGMVLTSAGHALVGPARRILRASAATRDTLINRGRVLAGRLDLSITAGAMTGTVPRLLAGFLKSHPKVTLNARHLANDADIIAALDERLSDAVFTELPLRADPLLSHPHSPLRVLEVGTSEIVFALPVDAEVEPDDAPLSWSGDPALRRVLAPQSDHGDSMFAGPISAVGQPALPPVIASKRETRYALVAAGVGSTYMRATLAERGRQAGISSRRLEPPAARQLGMVYSDVGVSAVAQAFFEFIRAALNARDKNASVAGDGVPSR